MRAKYATPTWVFIGLSLFALAMGKPEVGVWCAMASMITAGIGEIIKAIEKGEANDT